jgi:hypothetical protein
MQELERETQELKTQITSLKSTANQINEKLDNNLLKQIEILAVFVILISLIITNVLGIDALSSYGMRGLIILNAAYVISALLLMLGIKFLVIGFKKR